MKKPKICAVITDNNIAAVKEVEPLVECFEVRIDLIGNSWQEVAKKLNKPWIACNRTIQEGGNWQQSEARRKEELLKAIQLGADMVDIELETKNLERVVSLIKKEAKCILSFHELEKTPSLGKLKEIVKAQLAADADICKVVTTAQKSEDNLTILKLITEFPRIRIVAFAMGPLGLPSRILCPLVGGNFSYAAIKKGRESAPGQLTVSELKMLYEMVAE
jgi:3-dehydroquinate dehydratase type I|tara:strand:- start:1833 stop:2489 length:657 start_codon:yes stop_codon:yes gene_type:complete